MRRIPFFHDWDYQGYFGILDGASGDALFVSDAVADRYESIGKALGGHGQRTRLDYANLYHRARASLAC